MTKRLIAFLTVAMLMAATAAPVKANVQIPVDEVNIDNIYYVVGENIVTGEPILNPIITMSWVNPDQWANDIDIHEPDYYEIDVNNLTLGTSETITVLETDPEFSSQTLDLHNEMNLETGSFYEITVQPYHYHTEIVNDVEVQVLAPLSGEPEEVYAATDLQVEFVTDEDSIQVIWDDIGVLDFSYRIVYAVGDYSSSSKSDFENNKEGEINNLTIDSDGITSYYDPIDRRDKLSYTIDQNIYPGQIYSVMVEPLADYYNGQIVERNRNYPFIQTVSTSILLSFEEEGDYLRLQWNIPSSFQVGQDREEYALVEATLMEYEDGLGRNLVIFDGNAAAIGYYRVAKPDVETEYELHLVYSAVDDTTQPDITPVSNRVTYAPSDYLITPTKPYVPNVLSEDIIDDLKAQYPLDDIYPILEENYFVQGYSYGGSLDNLLDEDVTFHVDSRNNNINFVWSAFERIDTQTGNYIYDNNVYYDMWVTDELETLSYAPKMLSDIRYSSTTDEHVILNASEDIIGFNQQFNFYFDTDAGENLEVVPGKLYYIKIQAKKVTGQGTLISEPSIVTIYYTYGGSAYEPPTISKPPLEVKESETSQTSVSLIWKETWFEVISPDYPSPHPLSNWSHELWADEAGNIYDEETLGATYFPIYLSQVEVDKFEAHLTDAGINAEIVTREVTLGANELGLSDVRYKFLTVLYENVQKDIAQGKLTNPDYSFEEYFNDLVEADKDGTKPRDWQIIEVNEDAEDNSYLYYRKDNLVENTSYLLILYPYRIKQDGTELYAHYPTPMIVSTLPEEDTVTPDPTVPSLYTTGATDKSITLSWKYNLDFEYTLRYGLVEDVNEASPFAVELPEDILDPGYPDDGEYFEVTIDDLFPLTTYYFWIQATQTDNNTTSAWSNPTIGNTLDVDAPIPPRGLGLGALEIIDDYGYAQNVTEEYMIIEWIKDLDDVEEPEESRVQTTYTYIIEVADNAKFIDPWYIESSGGQDDTVPGNVEVLEKNLLKINDLVGNRHYYVRAKTRLVVQGSEDGQYIEKDSISYTAPIRIITLADGDEYDGYIDPALTILPEEDFELIYNDVSDRLEFRFRSDGRDEDGANDNQVDQRLISSLIDDNVHEYVIDMNSFQDQRIKYRRITIPFTIIEAFYTHDVDIKVLADKMTIDVAAEGIIDKVYEQVDAFGVAPSVIINLETLDSAVVMEELPETGLKDVSVPQDLKMNVTSSRKNESLYFTDTPMTLEMKTNSRYEVYEQDLTIYAKDNKANWSTVEGNYDSYTAMMAFETPIVGSYGLYTYDRSGGLESNAQPNHWSEASRRAVATHFTLEGLDNYNPDRNVTEKAMVQATYGTVLDLPVIDLTDNLNTVEMQTLVRSGIKTDTGQNGSSMSREDAISMFVRTAEIINGNRVDVTAAMLSDAQSISGVDSKNALNIAKAKEMGLISDLNSLRPNESLTYGEFFALWSRILD